MSDTPRVDALANEECDQLDIEFLKRFFDLASDLESNLTAAHKRIAELEQVSAAGVKRYEFLRKSLSRKLRESAISKDVVSDGFLCLEYLEGKELDDAIDEAMAKGVLS